MKRLFHISLLLLPLCLTGCLKRHGLMDNNYPDIQPVELYPSTPQVYAPGALFSDQHAAAGLISDSRAFRVNDIVIVNIAESTVASNTAATDLERSGSNSFKIPNLLGLEKTHTQFLGTGTTDGTVLGTSTESAHAGTGTTNRAGTFVGTLASRVIQVLPNGYLVVQGHKSVQVNDENVKVYISGIVNPLLISRNHTVSSNQIADLELRYGGYGVVTAQQSPGLFSRILQMLWPF